MRQKYNNYSPGLAIVQVGDRSDSNVYIKMKIKAAEEIGMRSQHFRLPNSVTQHEVGFKKYKLRKKEIFLQR